MVASQHESKSARSHRGGGALLTTSAWAGITISAPSQHNVPKYWSGTNCRAYISAAATGGDSIASAHVSISDGTTVLEETQTYPYPPYRVYSAFAYMFDSTQFVTGSTVTVQLEAWTLNGTKYTGSYSSKVKNYATLAELTAMSEGPSSQHGKAALAQGLGLIGYEVPTTLLEGWTSEDYLYSLAGCNFSYVHTHCFGPHDFWTDYSFTIDPPEDMGSSEYHTWDSLARVLAQPLQGNQQYLNDILSWRIDQMGSWPLPPENDSENPPINIAWIDSCENGSDNDFGAAYLYPYDNVYHPPQITENQGYMGCTITKKTNATLACVNTFTSYITNGYDLVTTRAAVYETYAQWCSDHHFPCPPQADETLHVWGDFAAKLRFVYTGVPGEVPPSDEPWREISP